MKSLKFIILLFIGSILFLTACKDAETPATPETVAPTAPVPVTPDSFRNSMNGAQNTAEPAQNTAGVWHYTCNKGCAGGSGSAVNCNTCGNTLAHNQAYHNSTAPAASQTTTPSTPVTPAAEPSQNSAGVWHYTCNNGCSGGSGTMSPCGSCGTTLVHNTAYHQ